MAMALTEKHSDQSGEQGLNKDKSMMILEETSFKKSSQISSLP